MSSPENDAVAPVQGDTTGSQVADTPTDPAPTDVTSNTYSEDEPYVTANGDHVWVKDGKTFRQDHTESVYVTDGDHVDLVRALTELGY